MEFSKQQIKLAAKYIKDNSIQIPAEHKGKLPELEKELERLENKSNTDPMDGINNITKPKKTISEMSKNAVERMKQKLRDKHNSNEQ